MNAAGAEAFERELLTLLEHEKARAAEVTALLAVLSEDAEPEPAEPAEPECPVTEVDLYAALVKRNGRWVRTGGLPGADVAPRAVLALLERLLAGGHVIRMSSARIGDSWAVDRPREGA